MMLVIAVASLLIPKIQAPPALHESLESDEFGLLQTNARLDLPVEGHADETEASAGMNNVLTSLRSANNDLALPAEDVLPLEDAAETLPASPSASYKDDNVLSLSSSSMDSTRGSTSLDNEDSSSLTSSRGSSDAAFTEEFVEQGKSHAEGSSPMTASSDTSETKFTDKSVVDQVLASKEGLDTALHNVERILTAVGNVERVKASDDEVAAKSLAGNAEEVKASEQDARNQLKYASRVSEFLEVAARKADHAHLLEQTLLTREEKASLYLENALSQLEKAASNAKNSEEGNAVREALRAAVQAQAEVVAGTAQQSQVTENMNTALRNALSAAASREALNKIKITPSIQRVLHTIESMQSSALQHSAVDKQTAKEVQEAVHSAELAEATARDVAPAFAKLQQARQRQEQELATAKQIMATETQQKALQGEKAMHLLEEAREQLGEDKRRARLMLQQAEHQKQEAQTILQAAAHKQQQAEQQKQADRKSVV